MHTGWWLTFDNEAQKKIEEIILSLSLNYSNGKVFIPHLSVYSYVEMSSNEADVLAGEVSKMVQSFKCKISGIDSQSKVSKTLYLKVEMNDELKLISKYFEHKFKQNFDFDPHISLIYKEDLDASVREELKQSVSFPKFVKIKAISYYQVDEEVMSAEYFDKWSLPKNFNFTQKT